MMRQGRIYDRRFVWRFILFLMVSIAALLSLTIKANAETFTFGGDTTGTSYYGLGDSCAITYSAISPATAVTLDSAIGFYHNNWYGPDSIAILIYNSDNTILDSTPHFAVNTVGRIRYKANFVIHAALAASTAYFVGIHLSSATGATGGTTWVYELGGTPNTLWRWDNERATIPATFVTDATSTKYVFAMLLFGTGEGGEEPPPFTGTGRRRMMIGGDD